jgi:hypothetical protein
MSVINNQQEHHQINGLKKLESPFLLIIKIVTQKTFILHNSVRVIRTFFYADIKCN